MAEEMSRDDFIKALAEALKENEHQEVSAIRVREIYEALQFDFPQISSEELKALASHMRETNSFPITNMLFRNSLELAQRSDASSSAAASLLIQCYFIPFRYPSIDNLDQFQLDENSSLDSKLLFIAYHTTYPPLSSLSLDDWNHYQCTDLCCSTAATLLHWQINSNEESILLQMEWMRYMYLLRDRMLQYPVTCTSILNKMVSFFTASQHIQAIESSHASSALVRLLLEVATSKDISHAPMAKSSIYSIIRSILPMISKHLQFLVDQKDSDDVILHAQLLKWAVLIDTTFISILEDTGILRIFIQYMSQTSINSVKYILRLLLVCMLFQPPFAAYVERVPSMKKFFQNVEIPLLYPSEYALYTLSKSFLNPSNESNENFLMALKFLFGKNYSNGMKSKQAIFFAIYVIEILLKLKNIPIWSKWPYKIKTIQFFNEFLPKLNQFYHYPLRDSKKDDESDHGERTRRLLLNRLRIAMKQFTSTFNTKLD